MTVYVDADACPVKEIIVKVCKKENINVVMVMDYNHIYDDGYSKVITVDKGIDSADFKIISLVSKNDICVTNDIGLCSVVLSKGVNCINFFGSTIDNQNIDELLFKRHLNKELRKINKKGTKFDKRTSADNEKFENKFINLIKKISQ